MSYIRIDGSVIIIYSTKPKVSQAYAFGGNVDELIADFHSGVNIVEKYNLEYNN